MGDYKIFCIKQRKKEEIDSKIYSLRDEESFSGLKVGDYVFVGANNTQIKDKELEGKKWLWICKTEPYVREDKNWVAEFDEILSFRLRDIEFCNLNLFVFDKQSGNQAFGRTRKTVFKEIFLLDDKKSQFEIIVRDKDSDYFLDDDNQRKSEVVDELDSFSSDTENIQYYLTENKKYLLNDKAYFIGEDQKEKIRAINESGGFKDVKGNIRDLYDDISRANKEESKTTKGKREAELSFKSSIEKIMDDGNYQVIFHGAPGTGKTYGIRNWMEKNCVKFSDRGKDPGKNVWQFVQFHPSYDYTDFVEGLRPVKLSVKDTTPTFVRMDGVFKKFCREAVKDEGKNRKYFFIIDEINRADLGKVFGELMFGLEDTYRGKDNAFPTQYMNLPTFEKKNDGSFGEVDSDVFVDGFYIPGNVFIIGTMNDIDRSVDSLDFAMRRRFKWVEVCAESVMRPVLVEMFREKIETDLTKPVLDLIDELIRRMSKVNNLIENADKRLGLSKDYCIGPAYLSAFGEYAKEIVEETGFDKEDPDFIDLIRSVWENRLHQILINYCRGRDASTTMELINKCKEAFKASYSQDSANEEE